jgi:hypothetical protein
LQVNGQKKDRVRGRGPGQKPPKEDVQQIKEEKSLCTVNILEKMIRANILVYQVIQPLIYSGFG